MERGRLVVFQCAARAFRFMSRFLLSQKPRHKLRSFSLDIRRHGELKSRFDLSELPPKLTTIILAPDESVLDRRNSRTMSALQPIAGVRTKLCDSGSDQQRDISL